MPQSPYIDVSSGQPVLDPGCLRDRIAIQDLVVLSPVEHDASGVKRDWVPFLANVPAAMTLYRGRQDVAGGQTSSEAYQIIVMYDPRQGDTGPAVVQTTHRVAARNGIYQITAIENVCEMNRVLELMCLVIGQNQ